MICSRVVVGLVIFQITTAGQLAAKNAITRSVLMLPLVLATLWFHHVYMRTYKPLTKFIALRSIDQSSQEQEVLNGSLRFNSETIQCRVLDTSEETGVRFMNPSLNTP